MPKALIAAPQSYDTPQSLVRAFRHLGWEARAVSWADPCERLGNRLRRLAGLSADRRLLVGREFNRVMRQQFIPLVSQEKPELLLIVKPHSVDDDVGLDLARLSVPIVTWATDSVGRDDGQNSLLRHSLAAYIQDGGDVSHNQMRWLPLGFDDEMFQPADDPKVWDVLFVGNLSTTLYCKRYAFFKMLDNSGLHRNYHIGFIGGTPFAFYNRLRWYPGKTHWVSPHLSMKELGRAIAHSRIVVNIHQNDGRMPINPMFFGIPGCRVCQVAEDREHLGRWLKPRHEYVAVNSANFVGVLSELLRDNSEVDRISAAGFAASAHHTYVARVRQILTECGFVQQGGPHRKP